ncbi:hypothetical protein O0L34_g7720 [Tuta absoluta]|nr:hypothetical protein O0L34_g7720 [Tuta absoluta]
MNIRYIILLVLLAKGVVPINIVPDLDQIEDEKVSIPNDAFNKHMSFKIEKRMAGYGSPIKRENLEEEGEMFEAAESNYEYRPLFVYRRIEHSRKRMNMFNAFAG